jgi:itaconate CoA-transferase
VDRVANRPAVDAHIAAVFAQRTREECVAALRAANTAYGFINGVDGLSAHPALKRITVATEAGPVTMAAPGARLSDGPRDYGPVPALGAHTEAVRAEFLPG